MSSIDALNAAEKRALTNLIAEKKKTSSDRSTYGLFFFNLLQAMDFYSEGHMNQCNNEQRAAYSQLVQFLKTQAITSLSKKSAIAIAEFITHSSLTDPSQVS